MAEVRVQINNFPSQRLTKVVDGVLSGLVLGISVEQPGKRRVKLVWAITRRQCSGKSYSKGCVV